MTEAAAMHGAGKAVSRRHWHRALGSRRLGVGRPTLELVVLAPESAAAGQWEARHGRLGVPVPIHECGEALADPRAFNAAIAVAASHPWNPYPRSAWVREGVARRLAAAQASLPVGYHLQILEGYRRPVVQRKLLRLARGELRLRHPTWSQQQLAAAAAAWVGAPDAATPAPHPTGGAVDLTLVGANGEPLEMNGALGWCAATAPTTSESIPDAARDHRQLLVWALAEAGLANNPAEWWHWSFGDPGWAARTGHSCAIYGELDRPFDWPWGQRTTDDPPEPVPR
jgi:D-alanyl-D-alanine dipeptidase